MTIEEFKDLNSMGRLDEIQIKDHAISSVKRILKPMKNESRKRNAYNFQYWVKFIFNGKEYVTTSREYLSFKELKDSFIPYFEQRNRQTKKQHEKGCNECLQ